MTVMSNTYLFLVNITKNRYLDLDSIRNICTPINFEKLFQEEDGSACKYLRDELLPVLGRLMYEKKYDSLDTYALEQATMFVKYVGDQDDQFVIISSESNEYDKYISDDDILFQEVFQSDYKNMFEAILIRENIGAEDINGKLSEYRKFLEWELEKDLNKIADIHKKRINNEQQ